MSQTIEFKPETFEKLFNTIFEDKIKIKPEVLKVICEYLKTVIKDCVQRGIFQAEIDDATTLDETHFRKILIQAMLDFR